MNYKSEKRKEYLDAIVAYYSNDDSNAYDDSPELLDRYVEASDLIQAKLGLERRDEWNEYGSGSATFLDSWFYKLEPALEFREYDFNGDSYHGVFVLFCKFAPLYVLGSGIKSWGDSGGSSYLPNLFMVDEFELTETSEMAREIASILKGQDLVRAYRDELSSQLPASIEIHTNLSDQTYTTFDGFFNWMD